MAKTFNKAPGQRQLRVGEELRHVLVEVLSREELRDPAMEGVSVTISEVRIGPDLRRATAYVMPLGGGDVEPILAALNRAAGFLRGRVSRMINLKFTPSFVFEADNAFDEASKIDALLRQAKPAGIDDDDGA
jgi:ribosome-binding factor A